MRILCEISHVVFSTTPIHRQVDVGADPVPAFDRSDGEWQTLARKELWCR